MELPDELYERIEALSVRGNDLLDSGDPAGARDVWREAYALLPAPRNDWEAAAWLLASIGEACYQLDDYMAAKDALMDALNTQDGLSNPFVYYMMGKVLRKLDDEQAIQYLLRAYMLDGDEIFDSDDEEGPECLRILQDEGLVPPDE
jgi:hypothetical protein